MTTRQRMPLADGIRAAEDQARYEASGKPFKARSIPGIELYDWLVELAERRRTKAAAELLPTLPTEREALQRLICSDGEHACKEIAALRAAGWTVETSICDRQVSIVAFGGKED